MDKTTTYQISDLSPHLFWDVDKSKIDWDQHQSYIITRVLEYGIMSDWKILITKYSKKIISKTCLNAPSLKPKSLALISTYLDLPKEDFKCYINRPLNQGHWIY